MANKIVVLKSTPDVKVIFTMRKNKAPDAEQAEEPEEAEPTCAPVLGLAVIQQGFGYSGSYPLQVHTDQYNADGCLLDTTLDPTQAWGMDAWLGARCPNNGVCPPGQYASPPSHTSTSDYQGSSVAFSGYLWGDNPGAVTWTWIIEHDGAPVASDDVPKKITTATATIEGQLFRVQCFDRAVMASYNCELGFVGLTKAVVFVITVHTESGFTQDFNFTFGNP